VDAEEAAEFTQLNVDEAREQIGSASVDDLEDMMRVEQKARDRKTVKEAIEDELHRRKVEESLSEAEHMLDEVARIFDDIEELEHLEPESNNLSEEDVIDFVTGNVDEAEKMLNNNSYSADELGELLRAEEAGKDRKTLSVTLHERIREAEETEEIEDSEQKLREIEEAIKEVEAEEREGLGESTEEVRDSTEMDETEEEESENKKTKNEDAENSRNSSTQEAEGGQSPKEEGGRSEGQNEAPGNEDEDGEEEPEEVENQKEFDKEKAIEELSDSFDRQKLENASASDLENLLAQERHRRDLIEELGADFEKERLKQATIDDLEALKEDVSEDADNGSQREESEKEEDEMKEEAEEDLKMLMGAAEGREEGESSEEGKVEKFKQNVHDRFESLTSPPSKGGNNTESRSKQALELLESYRDLSQEEAAIKTAHIMKGYLEHVLSIQREMTYLELSRELEDEDEVPDQLVNFFREMNKRQYTGNIQDLEVEEAIDNSVEAVEELS
jgi:hypothetical protein